ncbi:hypothetical protein BDA99DRAFT_133027 [Phascolomyces articulosus]|uniref:F-box domain-containing protein n=1 Tax=Phascolomyces articulosus TaxID=60185 RepID=A0AAD5PCA9_9FUNG|nr:hypothetical protein BDA99DRAFT_133027 [Phascolomyces articulosus]
MTQGPHCDMNKKGPQYQTLARLWENANACFDAQEWGTAMVDLNAAVTLIEENVLAITLLKRAMTHDRQGNSQAAIQDAFKAIELSPRFTDAYLCAGTLLKSVARFGEAIQIFTKGMDASKQEGASCTMGNEYSQEKGIRLLDQAKRALEWDMDVNNSHLFNKLPLELTNDIFTNLISFDDRVQCMYTCRTWQNFLLNEVPRMSRHLVLGNMPMSVMKRLVDAHSFNHGDSDGQGDTKGYNRVSILPSTSYHSIHNALSLLNNPHLRIKTFGKY